MSSAFEVAAPAAQLDRGPGTHQAVAGELAVALGQCGWDSEAPEAVECRRSALEVATDNSGAQYVARSLADAAARTGQSCRLAARELAARQAEVDPGSWLKGLDPSLFPACEEGFVQGAWRSWLGDGFSQSPKKAAETFAVCADLPGDASVSCAVGIGHRAPHAQGTLESAWDVCALVPPDLARGCVAGALMEAGTLTTDEGEPLVTSQDAFARMADLCADAAVRFPKIAEEDLALSCSSAAVDVASSDLFVQTRDLGPDSDISALARAWSKLAGSCGDLTLVPADRCRALVGARIGWATSADEGSRAALCPAEDMDVMMTGCREVALAEVSQQQGPPA